MNTREKVILIEKMLQECREELTRATAASPVVSNMMQEIIGFCGSCSSNAVEKDGQMYVPISSIANLQEWAQVRARELERVVSHKAGEAVAYERALEILQKEEAPGPAAISQIIKR